MRIYRPQRKTKLSFTFSGTILTEAKITQSVRQVNSGVSRLWYKGEFVEESELEKSKSKRSKKKTK